jgi:hypothetical protein
MHRNGRIHKYNDGTPGTHWPSFCGPLTPVLSPNPEDGLGERGKIRGNADPGRPQRGRRSRAAAAGGALGLTSYAPTGLNKEEAASCRFKNVQTPDPVLQHGEKVRENQCFPIP